MTTRRDGLVVSGAIRQAVDHLRYFEDSEDSIDKLFEYWDFLTNTLSWRHNNSIPFAFNLYDASATYNADVTIKKNLAVEEIS